MEQKVGFTICTHGEAEVLLNGRMCEVHPGTVMLRAPLFTALEVERSDGYAELEVMVPVEQIQPLIASYTPRFFADNAQFIPCQNLSDEEMERLCRNIGQNESEAEMLRDMPEPQRSLAESIVTRRRQTMVMEVVLLFLIRQTTSSQKPSRQEALFVAFMTTLSHSYAEHRDVAWYAGQAGLSVRHFSFMIHRHSGHTPMEWIVIVTIAHAKRLLSKPGVQVKDVADQLGFPEQFTFRKYFKQHAGLSPREFQKGEGVQR